MDTESKKSTTELTIDDLKREISVTNEQLDTRVEEHDLPDLAASFDDAEDYVERLGLSPTQQVDVRTRKYSNSNEAGVKVALKYWMSQNGVTATFRTLIAILLSLLKGGVAVRVCKHLSGKFSTSTPPSQERVLLNHKLTSYRDYLKSRYRAQVHKSSTQWPPAPTIKFFKLAMIQKEEIQRGIIDDKFVQMTVTGKIDDILQLKTPVDIENIFAKSEDKRKFVLIEGAPGSGKSTLALHICQEWAEGKLFQEFDVVVLVKLRDPHIREAKTIADILPRLNKQMADETEAVIVSLYGRNVLWVLDGWDELPSDFSRDLIITRLIEPGVSQECPLHESALMVTSRPSSSAELHPLVSSRVEVLGFTPRELEHFFTECLNGDSQAVQKLLERIRENPVVEGSCYLPLNASIVANCFLYDNHSLPTSNHGIFTSLVQSSLKRYLREKLGKTTPVGDITSPHSLASEIKAPFTQMCQLSYHGIENNKVTFTEEDMVTLSIPNTVSNIGLLQSVSSIFSDTHQSYYCFLYLSIQELLAAIHISLMSPKQQISVFQKLFANPRFSAVFQFYAGITKLRTNRPILSILPRILCPVPASIYDLIRKIIKKREKPLFLPLMHCLYEAEDSSLCEFVGSLLDHGLNLSNTTMNPIDCLAVGYFISACFTSNAHNKTFGLLLQHCSIGDQSCKFLTQGLTKFHSESINLVLGLFGNDIKEEGVHHLAALIKNTDLLTMLSLSHNAIGNQGLQSLCEALSTNASLVTLCLEGCSLSLENHGAIPHLLSTNTSLQSLNLSDNKIGNRELRKICESLTTNTSLKQLYLRHCSLTISTDNEVALSQLLSTNTALKYLGLSGNQVTSCRHIAAGLSANNTLRTLTLNHCGLTDTNIEDLVSGLGKIEELHIRDTDNCSLTMNGMKTLAQQVAMNPALKHLYIPSHLHSCIETVFREANEERKRNQLPKIDVQCDMNMDIHLEIIYSSS